MIPDKFVGDQDEADAIIAANEADEEEGDSEDEEDPEASRV